MKLLLIEPDRIMAYAERRALEVAGHSVQWRQTAQTGIDGVDHELPDAIVLEVQLGIHNGIEFLYELRSYPEWQHIPVVIYTVNHLVFGDEFALSLRKLGVTAALYKPRTSLRTLCQTVNTLAPIHA